MSRIPAGLRRVGQYFLDPLCPAWVRYGVPVAVAGLLAATAADMTNESSFLLLLMFGVTLSTLAGGFGPGMVATVIGMFAADYHFVHPLHQFGIALDQLFHVAAFGVTASVVAAIVAIARQAEAEVMESQSTYQSMVDDAQYPMLRSFVDPPALVLVNRAALEMLGYSSGEEVFRLDVVRDIYCTPSDRAGLVDLARRQRTFKGIEVDWRRRDGSIARVRLSGRLLTTADGREQLDLVAEDLTERRVLEQQLRQAQKMEAIGRLAGGVAHDFNNLVTVINGYADMLTEEQLTAAQRRKFAAEIIRAGERAASLTSQLLAFSRKQVMQPRVINLNTILAEVPGMIGRLIGEDIELAVRPAKDLASVEADPAQIEQILLNLIVNARDAMPKGGTITIHTENVILDDNYARQHPGSSPGHHVMLAVSDTGEGMDAETMTHMFEPFFTTKAHHGTGLGLSTVYGIVQQSGGSIWPYSEPGHGTIFKIYFPACGKPAVALPSYAVEHELAGTETILLVEDDDGLRSLVEEYATRRGYTVLSAKTPADALDALHAQQGAIALLITDVILPGMHGPELAQRVLAERPSIKVLYTSGYTGDAIMRAGTLERGLNFLQKPFALSYLMASVRAILDHPSGAPGLPSRRSGTFDLKQVRLQ